MRKSQPLGLTVAANLQRLMDAADLSQAELGRLAGIGQSTLSRILDQAVPSASNPRLSTIESLASHFNVAAWQLLVPDLDASMLADGGLGAVVASYCRVPEIGRQNILRIAESEARYSEPPVRFSKAGG